MLGPGMIEGDKSERAKALEDAVIDPFNSIFNRMILYLLLVEGR